MPAVGDKVLKRVVSRRLHFEKLPFTGVKDLRVSETQQLLVQFPNLSIFSFRARLVQGHRHERLRAVQLAVMVKTHPRQRRKQSNHGSYSFARENRCAARLVVVLEKALHFALIEYVSA